MKNGLLSTTSLWAAAALSGVAAWKLASSGQIPSKPAPYYLAFAVSLLMAVIAGWRSRERDGSGEVGSITAHPRWVAKNLVFAAAAALFFACTVVLQRKQHPPAVILLLWLLAMVFAVMAFPKRQPADRTERNASRGELGRRASIAAVLVFA